MYLKENFLEFLKESLSLWFFVDTVQLIKIEIVLFSIEVNVAQGTCPNNQFILLTSSKSRPYSRKQLCLTRSPVLRTLNIIIV